MTSRLISRSLASVTTRGCGRACTRSLEGAARESNCVLNMCPSDEVAQLLGDADVVVLPFRRVKHQRKRDARAVPWQALDRAGPRWAGRPPGSGCPPLRRRSHRRLSMPWSAWRVPTTRPWPRCRLLPAIMRLRRRGRRSRKGRCPKCCRCSATCRRLAHLVNRSELHEVGYPGWPASGPGLSVPLRGVLSDALYRGSLILIANTVAISAIGFVFWSLAAHRYPASAVGVFSSVTSAAALLAAIAALGLPNVIIRHIASAENARELMIVAVTAIVTVGTALCLAIVLALGPHLPPRWTFSSAAEWRYW